MQDIHALSERAKELRCLYAIDSIVSDRGQAPQEAFEKVLREIPAGWQDAESTGARIEYLGRTYVGPGYAPEGHELCAPIRLWGKEIGLISIGRNPSAINAGDAPFLDEESELLHRIAARLGEYLEWKHAEMLNERTVPSSTHWGWRQRFAEALADSIDADRFGVSNIYLGGSTARGDAGPASDIDLYIRSDADDERRAELATWIDGWSHCLAMVAVQQTGQSFPGGILNVQWLVADPGVWQRAELQELKLRTADQETVS